MMDEEKRLLKQRQRGRTLERKLRRHTKNLERDQHGLYRNKRAELILTFRPHDYWVKLWNMQQYDCDYDWLMPRERREEIERRIRERE